MCIRDWTLPLQRACATLMGHDRRRTPRQNPRPNGQRCSTTRAGAHRALCPARTWRSPPAYVRERLALEGAVYDLRRGRPQVSYFYSAGLVVRVHAACDAIWTQEVSDATE